MTSNPWDLPDPPGTEPVRGIHPWLWLISAAAIVGFLAITFFLPIPIFFGYLPGPVRDVEKLVTVREARTYSSEGSLFLTTVRVDTQVTIWDMLVSAFDEDRNIVRAEDVTGGVPLRRLQRQQEQEILDSKRRAQEVALSELGFARPEGDGARVTVVVPNAPADGRLQPRDLITSIDGSKVGTACDVGRLVDAVDVGDRLTVTVERKGETREIPMRTARNPQDPTSSFLGVVMESVNYKFDPGFEIDFKTGEIAGPSAGLMFSLALYDRLTPEDLTAGRMIAGTGTIDCDGGVGPIGGIEQKVAGAELRGAEIFLAPQANSSSAESVADDIEIVPISTFDDAIRYLEGLR